MKKKNTVLFITNHPDQLLFYKNLARMQRMHSPGQAIILCRVANPYDARVSMDAYKSFFTHIIEFPRIYQPNPLQALKAVFVFKKTLRSLRRMLLGYTLIRVVSIHSAWLGVNILLWAFRRIPIIHRWVIMDTSRMQKLRYDYRRTLYYKIYALACFCVFLPSFRVFSKMTAGGVWIDFHYDKPERLPGKLLVLKNPWHSPRQEYKGTISLPFPLFDASRPSPSLKKPMVVIFGNSMIFDHFKEFFRERKEIRALLREIFSSLETCYKDSFLYYKPHPADENVFMPGMRRGRYRFFESSLNAQEICEEYHPLIRAAYSFTSVSAVWSSFFGIPSYLLYPLLCNPSGKEFFDEFFFNKEKADETGLLLAIRHLDQVSTIDNNKRVPPYLTTTRLPSFYDPFL